MDSAMSPGRDRLRLALFMTAGMSLKAWDDAGILEREVALYERLGERGVDVGVVSYGSAEERAYAHAFPGMRILCNRWRFPERVYRRLLPFLFGPWLRTSHLIKTNQIQGARVACRAATIWRKPLIVRCGYLLSEFIGRDETSSLERTRAAIAEEEAVFRAANHVMVTSLAMAATVRERRKGLAANTAVIPNYVNDPWFRPANGVARDVDVLFVGRLTPQKNFEALLEAVERTDLTLTLVGDGPLAQRIEPARIRMGGRLTWLRRVPHEELPSLMNRSRVFVLPSLWEGHPKALIEAMACGMAVIGTDVAGVRDVISHGVNGWLCTPDAGAISAAITQLLGDPALRVRLGAAARTFAVENYALERIADMEYTLYREVVATAGRAP
jgi:glycosyltransferase involved in cell wall biosynthesis